MRREKMSAPPAMPVFKTPRGEIAPQLTHHFVDRHQQRFPKLQMGDVVRHVVKAMQGSVVISGLSESNEGDYFLWCVNTDRIMVMSGYMGVLMTCYKASESVWFKQHKAATMRWPSFEEVFGSVASQWDAMPKARKEAIVALREKQREAEQQSYLAWYENSKQGERV